MELVYEVEVPKGSEISKEKTTVSSTAGHSSAERLNTAIAPKVVQPSVSVVNEEKATTGIVPARVGQIQVSFNNKVFLITMPYNKEAVAKIKSMKRAWWNDKLRKWLVYGNFENLKTLQEWLGCWTPQQMEQLRTLIGSYEAPKQLVFYPLPNTEEKMAVELSGYGIDTRLLKQISHRTYDKSRKRWILPFDKKIIERLTEGYAAQGVQIENRLQTKASIFKQKTDSPSERKDRFLNKIMHPAERKLARRMADRLLQIGYSWNTIHAYVGKALQFYAWYQYSDLEKITPKILRNYLNELVGKGISESAHNTVVSSLKFLYGKIFELPHLMPKDIERPKKSFRLPRILSKQEVLRMIEVTDNLKHRVILFALYSSGLRLGELLKLKLQEIKWDRNQLFIAAAKGKKDRIVPLAALLKNSLQDYCQLEKPAVYLFESRQPGKPYSSTSVQAVVRQAAKKANITQKVTPHVLRHCFATHLHDGGVSIKLVQELLGHKDVKTTMIYTHVSTQTITAIKSPLDALGKKHNSDTDL